MTDINDVCGFIASTSNENLLNTMRDALDMRLRELRAPKWPCKLCGDKKQVRVRVVKTGAIAETTCPLCVEIGLETP